VRFRETSATLGSAVTDTAAHERIREQLSSYVEDELAPAERAAVDQHVATCAACQAELAGFRATLGQLGGLRAKAPGSFLADIQDQIRTRSKGRFFGRRHLLFGRIPFEWVSLAMILAMLTYYIITTHAVPTSVAPAP
jgi:anti-sigma factor RsiW